MVATSWRGTECFDSVLAGMVQRYEVTPEEAATVRRLLGRLSEDESRRLRSLFPLASVMVGIYLAGLADGARIATEVFRGVIEVLWTTDVSGGRKEK